MIKKIQPKALRVQIEEALKAIGLYSEDAVNLLMGTAAQESKFKYLHQIGGGPALGYFQMEPNTFVDICNNYLRFKSDKLLADIYKLCGIKYLTPVDLDTNLNLMIVFARLHYRRVKEPLPNTVEGYAAYWKDHYNTHKGAGTVEEFIESYKLVPTLKNTKDDGKEEV